MPTPPRLWRVLIAVAALAIVVAVAWLALRGPAPPTTGAPAFAAGRATRLAYLAPDAQGVYNLWAVPYPPTQAEGGTAAALTGFSAGISDYAVSPDGRWIALAVLRDAAAGGGDLWIVDNQGKGARRILGCDAAQCRSPAWSPGGERIAYGRRVALPDGSDDEAIWVVGADGRNAAPLLPDAENHGHSPRWSPQGDRIAFVEGATGRVRVVDLAGGPGATLDTRLGEPAAWSPTGEQLVAADIVPVGEAMLAHLFVFDLPTESSEEFAFGDAVTDGWPAWSPRGDLIAFGRRQVGAPASGESQAAALGHQIWLTRPDGSGARALTTEPDSNFSAFAWSPAGDALAAVRFDVGSPGARPEVWVFAVDAGAGQMLAREGTMPQWLP